MKKSVLIIFAVIVLIHFFVIYLVYRSNSSETAKGGSGQTESAVEKVENATDETDQKIVPRKEERVERPEPKHDRSVGKTSAKHGRRTFKPFNYSHAVRGDIKGLSGCDQARSGFLVDLDTREVLWDKNAKRSEPIASMTKMMTALLAFEAVEKRPDISLDTPIKVTRTANKVGGSQVWLDPRETFSLGDLLKTIQIKSANDSSELVAEYLGGGDRSAFIKQMNTRARELKMTGARFYNPHGLPGDTPQTDNVANCEDMALVAERLLEYPQAVKWASTWLDYIRKDTKKPTMLTNHNRLVNTCPGVNGMKTGYTQRAMFCTTVTCERNGRRLAAVVTGFPTWKARDAFVKKLLDWGYGRLNKKQ